MAAPRPDPVPVAGDAEHWIDAQTFTVWEPTDGLFLLVRLAVLPNVPAATAGVLAWLAAKPTYAYGHALDEAPLGDGDDLAIAGLHLVELDPQATWDLELDDGDNGLSLRWEASAPAVRYATPTWYATGHDEQTCRVRGRVRLHGRTIEVDAVGQREHTSGARDPRRLDGVHAVTGFLGVGDRLDGPAFDVLDLGAGGGVDRVHGYVLDGRTVRRVVAMERTTIPSVDEGGPVPQGLELVLTVDGGRPIAITGVAHGAPIRVAATPAGGVVHLQPMRFTTDDGLDGYGLSELVGP